MSVLVKRAGTQELPALQALLEKYFASIASEVGPQDASAAATFYVGESAQSWIAFAGGTPAGCVGMRPLNAHSDEIKHLYVEPEFRGMQIAHTLLEAAHAYARASGREEMYLDSLPSMHAAHRLYRRIGYEDTEPYYQDGVHRVFMRLKLG